MKWDKEKKKTVATIAGYFWFSLTFIWMLFQIAEYSFFKDSTFRGKELVFPSIITASSLLALLIYLLYPTFTELFYKRKSDEERFISIPPSKQFIMSKMLINSNLNYMKDDLSLLDPLIEKLTFEKDYDEAINIGVFNSNLLLRLDKHYPRVLNGLYILDALEKWLKHNNESKESKKYQYISNFVWVNDLGWSLYALDKHEVIKLIQYLRTSSHRGYIDNNFMRLELSVDNYKSIALNEILNRKNSMIKHKCFYKLICQSLRHICSIHPLKADRESAIDEFEKYTKKIENPHDAVEMKSNLCYLKAKLKCQEANASSDLEKAIEYIEQASTGYKEICDEDRFVKCYGIYGDIYKKLAYLDAQKPNKKFLEFAYDYYRQGFIECRKISRYDGLLKNLKEYIILARLLENNTDDLQINARIGLNISKITKNDHYLAFFRSICKPNHIILLRHGESIKNIEKRINGEGSLTQDGKNKFQQRVKEIKDYLSNCCLYDTDVVIYGYNKSQVTDSLEILSEIFPKATRIIDEDLKPTHMGVLFNQCENELNTYHNRSYKSLINWRNREISASELDIEGMEERHKYWSRAGRFFNNIKDNTCSIVVCTTSTAILLTHYIMGNDIDSGKYKCFDIPLCGVVHFIRNNAEYEMCNRDHLTNISFFEIESSNN